MLMKNYILKGQNWVKENIFKQELYHYGVKGMKWGVRKKPHYELLDNVRVTKKNKLIEEEIRSGKISRNINKDKQNRHTKDGHIPGRSYLDGDIQYAQKLVNKLSGTGRPLMDTNNKWVHKERVSNDKPIGYHVDPTTGKETKTKYGTIVYSRTGTHIYPRQKGDN